METILTVWIPTRNSKKSKCFIQCRLGTRKPFFLSLQMYRICTELPGEHTVLSYFQLFISEVICRKSEMLRLVRTSAISVNQALAE